MQDGKGDQGAHLITRLPYLVQPCTLEGSPEQASAEHRGRAHRCGDPQNLAPREITIECV
jgi:hypothetical protein